MFFMTVASPAPQDGALLDHCIARIAAGEQEAMGELYHKVRPAVYGFALSILKNAHDAEDVLQDTLLQVWQAAGSYHSHGKAMAWLMTITRNLSYDRLRQRARTESLGDEDWLEQLADRPAVTHEDRLTLAALLEDLNPEEQQIVTLHALTGLKHREIAALLELPLATVLSKYARALKKLQHAWKEAT